MTPASSPVAQPAPERSTRQSVRPSWPQARTAVVECVVLAVACLITYWLATHLLSRVHSVGRDDDLLGGMWAVLATIFVLRDSFGKSMAAAVSRMAATSVSFALCLIYLAFLPFHPWALAVLIGASALAVMLLGRPGDAVTAGITTAVIMVVAAVSPQHAWQQPILRLADTIIGVAVGAVAAWTGIWVRKFLLARSVPSDPVKVDLPLPVELAVVGQCRVTVARPGSSTFFPTGRAGFGSPHRGPMSATGGHAHMAGSPRSRRRCGGRPRWWRRAGGPHHGGQCSPWSQRPAS